MKLRPRNWEKFQHYKNRCPPWIKVHRSALTDRDYMCLPLASKGLAQMLWLLASEHKDGVFDASLEELAFRLRESEQDISSAIKPLLDKGFFDVVEGDASTMLATCLQHATPEREREYSEEESLRETKKPHIVNDHGSITDPSLTNHVSIKQKTKTPKAAAFDPMRFELDPDDNIDAELWKSFVEMRRSTKNPITTKHACDAIVAKLRKFETQWRHAGNEALSNSIANNWRGVFAPKPEDTAYRDSRIHVFRKSTGALFAEAACG